MGVLQCPEQKWFSPLCPLTRLAPHMASSLRHEPLPLLVGLQTKENHYQASPTVCRPHARHLTDVPCVSCLLRDNSSSLVTPG